MVCKKKKGSAIIITLITTLVIGMIVTTLRSARLNLSASIESTEVNQDADVAIRLLMDDVEKNMKKDFTARNFDHKGEFTYIQAETVPVTLSNANSFNTNYRIEGVDTSIEFIKDSYGELSGIELENPVYGTDYINYFAVDTNNNLIYSRVNSSYLSKAQAVKTYNPNYVPSTSKPRVYQNGLLNTQYSYDVATGNLKRALYVDIAENADIYNIKYPLQEKSITKKDDNKTVSKTLIKIPDNFKELYIVFCNEDKALPTGLFSNDYVNSLDITTDDIRDTIRKEYSFIRVYSNRGNIVVESALPIFESTMQNSTMIQTNEEYTVTNLKVQDKKNDIIIAKDNILNSSTSSKIESFLSANVKDVTGEITMTSDNRVRQYYTSTKYPEKITYTIKIPSKRSYKLEYRIFNKNNILVKKQEYMLEVR